jgi:TonB family protein
VVLRLLVDEAGKVVEVRQLSAKVGMGIDRAAAEAARKTTWKPATSDGVPIETWTILRIDFAP